MSLGARSPPDVQGELFTSTRGLQGWQIRLPPGTFCLGRSLFLSSFLTLGQVLSYPSSVPSIAWYTVGA
jgi:hypothetical protein